MEDTDQTAIELRALEERLLMPAMRRSPNALGELLADDFVEFGSSGRVFDKHSIIAELEGEVDPPSEPVLTDFAARVLAPGLVLVTYRLTRGSVNPNRARSSLRSSLWKTEGGRWRLLFHQGTAS